MDADLRELCKMHRRDQESEDDNYVEYIILNFVANHPPLRNPTW